MSRVEYRPSLVDAAMTHPGRTLFRLGLPILAQNLLEFCVGFYDVYLSGQIDERATSAVGLAAYIDWLAALIFNLLASGTTAIVAREWGAGNFESATKVAHRSLALSLGLGWVVFAFLQIIAPISPWLLRMDAETTAISVTYQRVDAFGQAFTCWTFIAAAALRGTGDMRTPLFVLGLTNVVNVLASPAFVYGWGPLPVSGVNGVVYGTVVARVTGAILMAVALRSGLSSFRLQFREVRWHAETTRRVLRIGLPAALDGMLQFVGHFIFLMIVGQVAFGASDAIVFAAHFVGVRMEAISYLPSEAWASAAASLVGQSLGAQRPEQAERIGWIAARQAAVYAGLIGVGFFFLAVPIYGLMHENPEVGVVGVPAMQLMAFYQIPTSLAIVLRYCLRGAGDTRFPVLCTTIGTLVVRTSLGYLFGVVLQGGLVGVWIGMGADNTLRALLLAWRFRSGAWKRTVV